MAAFSSVAAAAASQTMIRGLLLPSLRSSAALSTSTASSCRRAVSTSSIVSFRASSKAAEPQGSTPAGSFRRRRKPLISAPPVPTAEEAVNNIIYNTPAASYYPVGRHILNCLVTNEPGVLSRVSGILAARGFNIDSLVVSKTEVPDLSRMTIVLDGQHMQIEQARRQLEDLVPVWAVLDYTNTRTVERELLLVKVSTVPGHHVEELTEDEAEEAEEHGILNVASSGVSPLLATSLHRASLRELSDLFRARVVDVTSESLIIELCAKSERVDAFLKLLKPYGIIEASRSGMMAMPRSIMDHDDLDIGETDKNDTDGQVDATMLPPG
ncbi:acetolactate synthase [Gonapodya prolifera JEL478]|uniref:Acetolactate synthase n=1 Tax=Gonapodya prolifera (strain JEL478) TaxID=1344416 RepID=A0A139AUM4_GONPJ|nr:acetolactate synthase [Gonapodya prolifera JEL478]|eukprot:KXS20404.1 acetolactate synthase [Gonapodya prolifera JEL478]